jgi:hypothetical protein
MCYAKDVQQYEGQEELPEVLTRMPCDSPEQL